MPSSLVLRIVSLYFIKSLSKIDKNYREDWTTLSDFALKLLGLVQMY